ncbi:hypothetical protein DICPUDRAFT_44242 [Dictyostelium purpureum]|uniref:Uncharacterized protein n=1 Tax=Dictyostelium purpureum TaxID=5786 RepID=F1A5S7_DICPU|nr:uncharacterized protein DICPUDRAFT_44242 [Dictyostelium purpureum]EGC28453.1 hypothetical protein DICPUDRAFT_44242 [Dictyostelium purpureum]|eukprot:XP_003295021.1 hypothetical protein DICPUDRAFT_44242 [Dictyostelium purpureum]
MINFKGSGNQLSKYVDNNKKFLFLETHLFHSKKTLGFFNSDTIVEYITEFTDYYNRIFRDKNNNSICKRLLSCILKLTRVVWSDKQSSSDSILIVIDSLFKLILNVELRDSIEQSHLVVMLDILCQNRFFSQSRRFIEPLSPLSPTRMTLTTPSLSPSKFFSAAKNHLLQQSPTKNFLGASKNININNNNNNNISPSYPSSYNGSINSSFSTSIMKTPMTPFDDTQSLTSSVDSLTAGSIPFNHILNPLTLKESYIILIPLLFLYCNNDKNYRELKKYFGANIIEKETFEYFTSHWSITNKPEDHVRCANFILSLGNNSYLLKENKMLFLNTILNIINSESNYCKNKGIECLEVHLMNFIDTTNFYVLIIEEIYKHQEKFFNIFKKLYTKDPKTFSVVIEPHFSKLFKIFTGSSKSFNMLNILIKSVSNSFFTTHLNEFITKLIQIPITSITSNSAALTSGLPNINLSGDGLSPSLINNYKKYEVLDSIVYVAKLIPTEEMLPHVRILMKHFRTLDYIPLDDANTLSYESIIRSLVQLYKMMGESFIQLFYIAINSICKSPENTGGMVILGEIITEFQDKLRIQDIQQILKFIGSTCLCKRDIFPTFIDFYYRHSSMYEFNCYIEKILQKDIKSNIDSNFDSVIVVNNNSIIEDDDHDIDHLGDDHHISVKVVNNNISFVENHNPLKSSGSTGYNLNHHHHHQQQGNNYNFSIDFHSNSNIDDDCRIKSFINTLQFIRVIGEYCPNAYSTESQKERIKKIFTSLIEKLPQSVVNVFMYSGKKSVRFIYLLISPLVSLINSLPYSDDIYSTFMEGILQCIYSRKRQDPTINITPFIDLMLIINNEYVPGSKSTHYDAIIKQNILYYKNYYNPNKIFTSIVNGSSNSSNYTNNTTPNNSSPNLLSLKDHTDFSLFIDRRNPRFLLFLNQVLLLCSYKFLKKLVISYPAQLAQSSAFKLAYEQLSLRHKESLIKIIQSSSTYNPTLGDLLKSIKRPVMPLIDSSFKPGYGPLIKTIYQDARFTPEWKVSLSLVSREWFDLCQLELSSSVRSAQLMRIYHSIRPGVRFCLFEKIIHFSLQQILVYPMDQWKDIFRYAESIDLSGIDYNIELQRHLDILVEIDHFPNLSQLTLDSISNDSSSFNRIIDNISMNPLVSLERLVVKLELTHYSEVENVLEFFKNIHSNAVSANKEKLNIEIEFLNSTCDWLISLVNELYILFNSNNSNSVIKIRAPYPDDRVYSTYKAKGEEKLQEITNYINQCVILVVGSQTDSYESFDYSKLLLLQSLVISNCEEFGIFFEINFVALLENTKHLNHLSIDNITNLNQLNQALAFIGLNHSLESISLTINTSQLDYKTWSDSIFSGTYFYDGLKQLFKLLNSNQTISSVYIATHNDFSLLDDLSWSKIDKGQFKFINQFNLQLERSKKTN